MYLLLHLVNHVNVVASTAENTSQPAQQTVPYGPPTDITLHNQNVATLYNLSHHLRTYGKLCVQSGKPCYSIHNSY